VLTLILGISAAIGYGLGNFIGGAASKKAASELVTFGSQSVALVFFLVTQWFVSGEATTNNLAWGAAAGLFTVAALLTLYKGLATGKMSIVAPLSAVILGSVQVLFGLATGERPPFIALIGVCLAVVSIVLVAPRSAASSSTEESESLLPVVLAIISGLCFGGAFICLSRNGTEAGLWPLISMRVLILLCLLPLVIPKMPSKAPKPKESLVLIMQGLALAIADMFFVIASRKDDLAIVGPLVALSPVVVIILARIMFSERWNKRQAVGVYVSLGSVLMIALR
jgi:uncharacterized membrane protein